MAASSEALNTVKATEPTQWLAPSPELSQNARAALKNLFSSLRPFTPKSPFDKLLVEGFDAEQIWQQIDIQSQPLISNLRRELRRYEKNPEEIKTLKVVVEGQENLLEAQKEEEKGRDDFDGELEESDEEEEGDDDDVEEMEEGDDEDEDEEEEEEVEEEGGGNNEIEDGFFSIKELGKYLKTTEAEEYEDDKEDGEEAGEDEAGEDDDVQELMNLGEGEDDGEGKDARYEDFFGNKELSTDERTLSTHEKEQLKRKTEIEQRENAMMDPKTWTMQGEVTATKRPRNSALEVDLDFEHNVRPAPPITEEVTVAVEDMIRKRIEQELFDDVQRAPTLRTKAPRERKEMDEKKSEKGLAGEYEQEYLQKINADSGPLSSKDKQKIEADMLFRKLCLKLDALSHFHFTPKPVIEDMTIQDNVPALVMEEIAPVAVSDAAMLAPEEVFSGKGDIKEEAELTQAERKRRRANKKRKFKAVTAQKVAKKPRDSIMESIEAM